MLRHQSAALAGRAEALPAAAAGSAVFLNALAIGVLMQADDARVYILGHPVELACALRTHFGIPCPTCGFSRAVVLALHGSIGRAWHLAPGAAAGVCATLAFAAALLILAALRASRSPAAQPFGRQLRRVSVVCAVLVGVIWAAGWAAALQQARHPHFSHLTTIRTQIE